MGMFCFQCEQAAGNSGCRVVGNCGKEPETAALQDLLLWAAQGIAMYAHRLNQRGKQRPEFDRFVSDALFSTVTNVNFDPQRLEELLRQAHQTLQLAQRDYAALPAQDAWSPAGPACWTPAPNRRGLLEQANLCTIESRVARYGNDVAGLQELLAYGLKGAAAYAVHARVLRAENSEIYAFFHEALAALGEEESAVDRLLALALRCGEINLETMAILDAAHTRRFGHPSPTSVRVTPIPGKAILVSGHDLQDLEELLKQTQGTGINVYTHGEMLPAHGYPELRRYAHLAGNYGGAWQDQFSEFAAFPGAILMTTNCIQRPAASYAARIFTSGLVAWPGVTHVSGCDFSPVIQAALAAPGFGEEVRALAAQSITVGFGHQAVLGAAEQIIAGVKSGKIRHFFLVGGCDGAKPGRNYYSEFAASVPADAIILTLACGKYRFNKMEFGEVAGLPRLLDIGQCNDAYSAIRIAGALADAFGCGVNDLPLSLILSWYEQKAVAILLTLLHLGIKNIRLGPSLPAFLSPAVVQILSEKFGLRPIGAAQDDIADCLRRAA